MDAKTLDRAIPILYVIVIVICSLWIKSALPPVAVIGALLLGLYYVALRPKMLHDTGEGRERNRHR